MPPIIPYPLTFSQLKGTSKKREGVTTSNKLIFFYHVNQAYLANHVFLLLVFADLAISITSNLGKNPIF